MEKNEVDFLFNILMARNITYYYAIMPHNLSVHRSTTSIYPSYREKYPWGTTINKTTNFA